MNMTSTTMDDFAATEGTGIPGGASFRELTSNEIESVSGGNQGMIMTGAGMIGSSIGMAALGAAALGPIGIAFAAGLAFGGGVFFGSGSYRMFSRLR